MFASFGYLIPSCAAAVKTEKHEKYLNLFFFA